jgi:hypothetical protein
MARLLVRIIVLFERFVLCKIPNKDLFLLQLALVSIYTLVIVYCDIAWWCHKEGPTFCCIAWSLLSLISISIVAVADFCILRLLGGRIRSQTTLTDPHLAVEAAPKSQSPCFVDSLSCNSNLRHLTVLTSHAVPEPKEAWVFSMFALLSRQLGKLSLLHTSSLLECFALFLKRRLLRLTQDMVCFIAEHDMLMLEEAL